MVSKRIKFISSLIDENDKVIDIGTDHALLPIYLIKNNLCIKADGADISAKVLDYARTNISKYNLENKINLFLSDGLSSIEEKFYNTIVICGMGFHTIKSILTDKKAFSFKKIIIQSNNDHENLRHFLVDNGFFIEKEYALKDKNINYLIFKARVGHQSLNKMEYLFGIYNKDNLWFYQEFYEKQKTILKKIPLNKILVRFKIKKQLKILKKNYL